MKLNETSLYKLLEEKQDQKSIDELEKAHWYLMSIHGMKMRETPTTIEYMNEVTNDYYTIYSVTDITITSLYINFEENKICTECTLYYFLGQAIIEFATINQVEEYSKTYYGYNFVNKYIRFINESSMYINNVLIPFELLQNRSNINLILEYANDVEALKNLVEVHSSIMHIGRYKVCNNNLYSKPFTYVLENNTNVEICRIERKNDLFMIVALNTDLGETINDDITEVDISLYCENYIGYDIPYITEHNITFDKEFRHFVTIKGIMIPKSLLAKESIHLTHYLLENYEYGLLDKLIKTHISLINDHVKMVPEQDGTQTNRITYLDDTDNVKLVISLDISKDCAYDLKVTYSNGYAKECTLDIDEEEFTLDDAKDYIIKYYGEEVFNKFTFTETYFIINGWSFSSFNNKLLESTAMINEMCRLAMSNNQDLVTSLYFRHNELVFSGFVYVPEDVNQVVPFIYTKDNKTYFLQYNYENYTSDDTNEVSLVCIDYEEWVETLFEDSNEVKAPPFIPMETVALTAVAEACDNHIIYDGEKYPITEATLKLLLKLISK